MCVILSWQMRLAEDLLAHIQPLTQPLLREGLMASNGDQTMVMLKMRQQVLACSEDEEELTKEAAFALDQGTAPPYVQEATSIMTKVLFRTADVLQNNGFEMAEPTDQVCSRTKRTDALYHVRCMAGGGICLERLAEDDNRPWNIEPVVWATAKLNRVGVADKAFNEAFPRANRTELLKALRKVSGVTAIRNECFHPKPQYEQLSPEELLARGVTFICLLLSLARAAKWEREEDQLVRLLDRTIVWYLLSTDMSVQRAQADLRQKGDRLVALARERLKRAAEEVDKSTDSTEDSAAGRPPKKHKAAEYR